MAQSVLDLGLQPTKRAKAQAERRQKESADQAKVQTANQLESAQQLQSYHLPASSLSIKPLGLQEIGQIFDQETRRMWNIDLRQRGLVDGFETRDKLSQLYHELFRVNQCKILDRYWRRVSHRISQRDDAREIARRKFRIEIYKRCKEWFENENSTIYLDSHTELDATQLQLWGDTGMPSNTVCFSKNEGVSCAQSDFGSTSVRPLDTDYLNSDEGVGCAQSQFGSTSMRPLDTIYLNSDGGGSLPDTVDPGYNEDLDSVQLQLGRNSVWPLDTERLGGGEGVSCAQLQLRGTFERPPDTNNSDIAIASTLAYCSCPPLIQKDTGQEHNQYTLVGNDSTYGYDYEHYFHLEDINLRSKAS